MSRPKRTRAPARVPAIINIPPSGIGHNRPPVSIDRVPDRVLTLKQWAALNAMSLRTAARLIRAGDGPPIIQLTSRRVGVRESDAAKWQAERMRGQSA